MVVLDVSPCVQEVLLDDHVVGGEVVCLWNVECSWWWMMSSMFRLFGLVDG